MTSKVYVGKSLTCIVMKRGTPMLMASVMITAANCGRV